ncbi:MAG: hypothetical protein WBZ22_17865, partial [Pseudolabrys sp.]
YVLAYRSFAFSAWSITLMTVSHLDCRTDRIKSSNRPRSETQGNTQEPGRETGGVEPRAHS